MADPAGETLWLTVGELAARWRISGETIRRRITAGEIPALPVGTESATRHRYRISLDWIERQEAESTNG